ncbi:GerMN domain-containing protein [Cytobacillus sp. FJAT-54145]|uniref:GerMN domain-containing protein n=1 Tax=Cytobacillus spartinae TaxID=3299023 RepID=A0ABW6KLP6_9BACI
MSKNKKTTIVSAVIVSSVLLSGCGLFGGDGKEKIDPPVSYSEEAGSTEVEETTATGEQVEGEEAVESSIMTELYLVDKNGYVVPQTFALPKTDSVAKQALEFLVQNGPVTEMLPNGFAAVLPADTQMTVDIKDKTAVVDFSKEFKNYQPEDEMKILEAVTWTLTQFDTVENVKLQMNGHELTEMPVNGTPIGKTLSRANGINMDTTEVVDITNTKGVTVYYLGGDEDSYYYVPVTRRVSNDVENNIAAVVGELVKGPSYTSSLLTDFLPDVALVEEPKVEDGKVTLNFNEAVYGSFEEKIISQHLLNSLVLSLTEQKGIESVAVTVNGEAELVNENGEKLTEPVTRPENVNTGSF